MDSGITIRSDLQSNWPFVLLMSIPWLLIFAVALRNPQQKSLIVVLLYFPIFLFWLTSYRVTFFPNSLEYASLFSNKKVVEFNEIKHVNYKRNLESRSPVFSFLIEAGTASFAINAKPFSKIGISQIAKMFVKAVGRGRVTPEILDFAKGDFAALQLTWQQRSQLVSRLAWMLFFLALIRSLVHFWPR